MRNYPGHFIVKRKSGDSKQEKRDRNMEASDNIKSEVPFPKHKKIAKGIELRFL